MDSSLLIKAWDKLVMVFVWVCDDRYPSLAGGLSFLARKHSATVQNILNKSIGASRSALTHLSKLNPF